MVAELGSGFFGAIIVPAFDGLLSLVPRQERTRDRNFLLSIPSRYGIRHGSKALCIAFSSF
jgi:hypothetical protein